LGEGRGGEGWSRLAAFLRFFISFSLSSFLVSTFEEPKRESLKGEGKRLIPNGDLFFHLAREGLGFVCVFFLVSPACSKILFV
jgi:hypothetical protein